MLSLLPILVAALLLLALLGISVVAWLPDRWRPSLLPAVLVLGAMVLVVGLHATSIIVGVRFGPVVVVLVGVIALAIRTRRVRWWVELGGLRWCGARPWSVAYTHVHLDVGLRIGEELDQAAIALAGLHDPAESFYTVMALCPSQSRRSQQTEHPSSSGCSPRVSKDLSAPGRLSQASPGGSDSR